MLVLGITEDPASTPAQVILWVAHSDGTIDQNGMFQGADIIPAVDTSKLEEVLVVGSPYSAMAPGSTAEGASK